MSRILVDSSAWYALAHRRDPQHEAVEAILRQRRNDLVTTNFVADETLTLLRSHLGWSAAHAFGERLRAGRLGQHIRIMPTDEEAAWDIFVRYRDHAFSFTDCTSFAVMRRLSLDTAITLDSDFRSFGVRCLP